MRAPLWLGSPERLDRIGGWPEVAGGQVLGPFRERETGASIVKLKIVHPPEPDATVLFAEEGKTAVVVLRFTGVARFSGHRSEVFKTVINNLVVTTTSGPDGVEVVRFELLNPDGDRLLMIEAGSVSVDAVQVPARYPIGRD